MRTLYDELEQSDPARHADPLSVHELIETDNGLDELEAEIRRRGTRRHGPAAKRHRGSRRKASPGASGRTPFSGGKRRVATFTGPKRRRPQRIIRRRARRFVRRPAPRCVCPVHGNEFIRWIQQSLHDVASIELAVTGVMNAATREALRDFQRREGLPVDGIAGPETERALLAARAQLNRGTTAGDASSGSDDELFLGSLWPSRYLRRRSGTTTSGVSRSSATYIRWVQKSLNGINGLRLDVDGIIGPKTRSAIRDFQRQQGLAVDGVVGPVTERALIRAGASAPPTTRKQPGGYPSPVPVPRGRSGTPSALRRDAARVAVQQWERWRNGSIKECESGIRQVLQDYWQTGVGFLPNRTDWCSGVAWSAAFISWVMKTAGAGNSFKYSSAHTDYVAEAKRNRLANNNNPFKTYRIDERAPRVGDLVCKERANSGVNFDNVDQGFRSSHCDIVTRVLPGKIETIGGNLSDSVRKDMVSTDGNGRITERDYYAVVQVGT